jgi:hypothetical protein
MTKQEIMDENKLIIEFMEYTQVKADYFYDDWNWLMPVVEKIKFIDDHQDVFFEDYYSINFKMEFFYGVELWIDKERLFLQTAFGENTLIDAVYRGVIEFIKWYNKNKKVKGKRVYKSRTQKH